MLFGVLKVILACKIVNYEFKAVNEAILNISGTVNQILVDYKNRK